MDSCLFDKKTKKLGTNNTTECENTVQLSKNLACVTCHLVIDRSSLNNNNNNNDNNNNNSNNHNNNIIINYLYFSYDKR